MGHIMEINWTPVNECLPVDDVDCFYDPHKLVYFFVVIIIYPSFLLHTEYLDARRKKVI